MLNISFPLYMHFPSSTSANQFYFKRLVNLIRGVGERTEVNTETCENCTWEGKCRDAYSLLVQ